MLRQRALRVVALALSDALTANSGAYNVAAMENELQALESKLGQLIALTRKLRAENHSLRQQLAQQTDENRRAQTRLEEAAKRLESLLEQVPES